VWIVSGVLAILSGEEIVVGKLALRVGSRSDTLQERRQQFARQMSSSLSALGIFVITGLCSLGDSKELFKYQQIEKVTCYRRETPLLITEVS